jgi:hypothetical protein
LTCVGAVVRVDYGARVVVAVLFVVAGRCIQAGGDVAPGVYGLRGRVGRRGRGGRVGRGVRGRGGHVAGRGRWPTDAHTVQVSVQFMPTAVTLVDILGCVVRLFKIERK